MLSPADLTRVVNATRLPDGCGWLVAGPAKKLIVVDSGDHWVISMAHERPDGTRLVVDVPAPKDAEPETLRAHITLGAGLLLQQIHEERLLVN